MAKHEIAAILIASQKPLAMTGRIRRTLEHEERERARKTRKMSFQEGQRPGVVELLAMTGVKSVISE
jgi:hypothetical protein